MAGSVNGAQSNALWKTLTTTVGLIVTRCDDGLNVMAAEWTYFVAKNPLHVAVVLTKSGLTHEFIPSAAPFTVTLCSADQADLADFVGSFSGRDIDKATSAALTFRPSVRIETPWIDGGVTALECVERQRVDLPGYFMIVGEVVQSHLTSAEPAPLVKHGGMYELGNRIRRTSVVAAAELVDSGRILRIAATGPNGGDDPYSVVVTGPGSALRHLGEHLPNRYGDLFLELEAPVVDDLGKWTVVVSRPGLDDGRSSISTRSRVA